MHKRTIPAVFGAIAILATVVYAAVTFDPATGTGFVGKGDVQLVYGWNNQALQQNASNVAFQATSTVVTEVSWVCTKPTPQEVVQERQRTTTTSIAGLLSSVGRERNQVTGFLLNGYAGIPTESSTTEGPALNSCPSASSGFVLTTPAGDPVVVSSSSTLQVSINGTSWFDLN